MDDSRFDLLTRSLATSRSRRRLFGSLVAIVFGLTGTRHTVGATCRAVGSVCREDATCCSGLCNPKDARGRRRCGCRTVDDCPAAGVCRSVACQAGVCVTTITPGAACDDGNPCTVDTTCTATGRCTGQPVVCSAQDDCHRGSCDRSTGECRQDPLTGTPCDDGNGCTLSDTCQNGTCVGTPAPVDCEVSDWGLWVGCTARCGGGTEERTRTVVTPASCGGTACPTLSETRPCNTMACAACTDAQWNSTQCSNFTFVDGAVVCTGGGQVGAPPCCASDADCPERTPFCVVSYTEGSSSHTLHPTVCPTDSAKGLCSAYVACTVAP